MKKYLIRGALALVVCGCMISCQDHDEFVGNVIQAKTQAFDETFVEAYGEIQAGHDWGFGSVGQAIRTRSEDANNNMWYTYEGITIPSPITAAERKAVADLFSEEHREACTVTIDLTNFFIQQVYKGGSTYSSWADQNGAITENILGSGHMEEVGCGPDNDYVNTANHGTLAATDVWTSNSDHHTDSIMLMVNSSTSKFWYKNTLGTKNTVYDDHYFIIEYNGNYYVGFDFQSEADDTPTGSGYLEGDKIVDRDYRFNDWIVKIVPAYGDGPAPQPKTIPQVYEVTQETAPSAYYEVWKGKRVTDIGRVMAEDLGSSDKNDMDYNDVVFEARIVTPYTEIRQMASEGATEYNLVSNVDINNTSYTASDGTSYANIKLLAAGGTIPITVAGIDVHNAFGSGIGKTTMINTENPNMTNGTYATRGATDLEKDGGSKDFEYTTIDAIPIAAQYANGVVEIKNTYGKVPHKIRVPTEAPWPIERVEMNTAYGNKFGSGLKGATGDGYVQDRTVQFWTYAVSGNVNNLEGFGQSIGDVFDEERTAYGTVNGQTTYTTTLMDAVNTTYPTVESGWTTVWTRGDNDGYLYNDGSSHGIYIDRANFSGITVGSKVRIYGVYRSGFNVYTAIGNGSEANYNQSGYIELDVASDTHAKTLAEWSGLSITGEKFTVTDVAIKVAAQQEPTVPERRGTVVWGANEGEGNTTLDWSSSTVFLSEDYLAGKGVKENSIIRFYGIGLAKDWQMKVNANWDGLDVTGWSADDKGVHAYQTYWGNNSQYNQGFEFSMNVTKAIADQILDKGLRISGVDFKLMYITVQNPSTPSTTGGTVVWSPATYNNSELVSGETLGLASGSPATLTLTAHHPANSGWYVTVMADWNNTIIQSSNSTNSQYGQWDKGEDQESDGTIVLPLSANDVAMLLNNGLRIQYGNMTVSKIELRQ